jgi:phenylpropionate dioxygenase-like ring-hydroxylating dioxygenase large terminal subunit
MAGRFPFSTIPSGWYAIAGSSELPPGGIVTRRYFERDLVLYRTMSGVPRLTKAYCPHMGAHLGRGRIEGEELRCAFHGFRFDLNGSCASTPYGGRPPAGAVLTSYPVVEQNGWILTWFDANDKPPEWTVPSFDDAGWLPIVWKRYEVPTHPQETTENSVDFGHFTAVHKFLSATMTRDVETDGPLLTSGFDVVRSLSMIGLPKRGFDVSFEVAVWGLGYSQVDVTLPRFGQRLKLFVLPVPIDKEHIHLRLGCMAERRFPLLSRILRGFAFWGFQDEVREDIPIWSSKVYEPTPALAEGDGPIATYRRWAQQFYSPAKLEA